MPAHDGSFSSTTMARRVYDYLERRGRWVSTFNIALSCACPNVSTRISEARRCAARLGMPGIQMKMVSSDGRRVYAYRVSHD